MAAEAGDADRWLVVTVRGPSEALSAAAEGLFASGAGALEELPDGVRTWFDASADAESLVARLKNVLREELSSELAVTWEWMPDEDWSATWRRGLAARRVGGRVIITPSWCKADPRPDDVVVTIDPQMAFGTGEHATTRGVIRLMQDRLRIGDVVLDVGAGSAVLAIAAVLLGASRAEAVEGDAEALPNAAENIVRNGVAGRVSLEQAWVDEGWLAGRARRYDLIVANVLSSVLRPLLGALRQALRPDGALILSGILASEAEDMRVSAETAGFAVSAEDREEEWWTVMLQPVA